MYFDVLITEKNNEKNPIRQDFAQNAYFRNWPILGVPILPTPILGVFYPRIFIEIFSQYYFYTVHISVYDAYFQKFLNFKEIPTEGFKRTKHRLRR